MSQRLFASKNNSYMPEVLIVDDEENIRELIKDILSDDDYVTTVAADGFSAVKLAYQKEPDVVLLDVWLEGSDLDGLTVLEKLKERYIYLPVIAISDHGNIAMAVKSLHLGAYDYIEKPFTESRLKLIVKRAVESGKLRRENDELKAAFESYEIVGHSSPLKNLRSLINKVAVTSSRVLITGSPGSGKEVVARLIHQKSKEHDNQFVSMYSSILPEDNYLANIFGREEKDHLFSDIRPYIGIVEQANRGTLFIDEVSDLRYDAQLRMLRFLQDGKIYREGGKSAINVDVRIIASSAKNLEREVVLSHFHENLYYRLNVFPIRVPSLSEYCSDIPEICRYFMKIICQKMGLTEKTITEDALMVMQSYNWPGNLRQLRNVIEWSLIMSSKDTINVEDLPCSIFSHLPVSDNLNSKVISAPLKKARREFEKLYLKAQLKRFSGNVSKTAAFVRMERSALHRKLKTLGLYDDVE